MWFVPSMILAVVSIGLLLYALSLHRRNAGLAADLEEQQRIGRQLSRAAESTCHLRTAGLLCNGIAHDFNNALTAILGYCEMVREQLADKPDLASMMAEISKAGQNARDITRRMLAFGRHTAVEIQLLPAALVLRDTRILLRAATPSRIDIKAPPAPQQEAYLMLDFNQLLKAMIIVTSFLVQHMPQEETSVIRLSFSADIKEDARKAHSLTEAQYAALTLSAALPEWSTDDCAQLFTPFSPIHRDTPDGGLDAACVPALMRALRGAVEAKISPEGGLVCSFWVPAHTSRSV